MTSLRSLSSPGLVYEMETSIPMRDGTILRANVWRPDRSGAFPAILERTPYGKAAGLDCLLAARFVHAGFAYIIQDIRGRYASDGTWIPFSEPETGDAADGFDTVEWLAAQPWCNGRVGTSGASYVGWTQWQLAALRPPHHAAMSARSIPPELTDIDWNGGFKLARRIHWWHVTMAPDLRRRLGLPPPNTPAEANQLLTETSQAALCRTLPLARLTESLPPGLAETALAWMRNPASRPFGFTEKHAHTIVPNLDITGWYDHCSATIGHFAGLRKNGASPEARAQTRLLIGPWNHMAAGRRKQGAFDFGPAAELDITGLLLRWFDRWLRGTDNGVDREPPVRYFVLGSNEWKSADDWPPAGAVGRTLFLRAGKTLDGLPPAGSEPADPYTTDPNDPVPSLCESNYFTLPADRRRLDHRTDILRYVSEPLERDLEIAGYPEVVLHAASTAPDTDFFARLADDDPCGAALEICYGMTRARHRNGLDTETPLTPGEPSEIRIQLGPTACRFKKGHRIRLEITGGDFPLHDRNHQTGGNDLFESDLRPATQSVFHTDSLPSRLILPMMG
jgi:putative CocE/NonD family hydrolase